jgi:type II secretory pathway component PulF
MPNYIYKAINQGGTSVSGTLRADSVEMAEGILSGQGYIPSKITEEGTASLTVWMQNIERRFIRLKPEELILFTKQFRTMLVAGIPILQLFRVLENQTENKKLKNAIAAISLDIREGLTLYEAFSKQKNIFSPLYTNMIRAGEQTGTLPDVLGRLIYILEHEHKVKSDVKAALQYPIIVVIALMIAFVVLLTFVIPKFVGIFARSGVALPFPTRISIVLYSFLNDYWQWLAIVIVTAILAIRYCYKKTERGKYLLDSIMLNIPIMGPLFLKTVMSRFASIFSILQSTGFPVMSSLDVMAGTIGNQAVTREFLRVRDMVEEGRGIANPLRSAKYFTPMVVDMIAIGEESGRLEEMLREISVHYDDEVEFAIKRLSATLGPILIVGLAVVVGFFALSIFLPMWDLTQVVRKGF